MSLAVFSISTVAFYPNPATPTSIQVTGPAIFGSLTTITVVSSTSTTGQIQRGYSAATIYASSADFTAVVNHVKLMMVGVHVQLNITYTDPGDGSSPYIVTAITCTVPGQRLQDAGVSVAPAPLPSVDMTAGDVSTALLLELKKLNQSVDDLRAFLTANAQVNVAGRYGSVPPPSPEAHRHQDPSNNGHHPSGELLTR